MQDAKHVTRFSRIRVKDPDRFRTVHAEAMAIQAKFGLKETVYQAFSDPNELTIMISGNPDEIEAWLKSSERTELAEKLELIDKPESWLVRLLVD